MKSFSAAQQNINKHVWLREAVKLVSNVDTLFRIRGDFLSLSSFLRLSPSPLAPCLPLVFPFLFVFLIALLIYFSSPISILSHPPL